MIRQAINFIKGFSPDFVKLLTGSGVVFGVKVLGAIAGYLLTYLITTSYGAETFGVFELCLTFMTILGVLGRLGLDGALVRFIPEYKEKKEWGNMQAAYKHALKVALPVSTALAVILFFSSDFLAGLFDSSHLSLGLKITAVIIPVSTWMGLNAEVFRGMKNMKAYSFFQRGTVVLIASGIILALGAAYPEWEQNPLISFGAALGVLALIAGVMTPKRLFSMGSSESKFNSSDFLLVAFPMLISTSMFMVMNWTDTIMIGVYMEESQVGIYRLAFKVAALVTFAQFAINSIAAPMFSSFKAKGDMPGLRKMVRNIGYLNVLISVPIFIIIMIFPELLLEIFGDDFKKDGVKPLRILAVASVINALCGPVMYLLNMTGKEKSARNIILVASVLNLVLNLCLIPHYRVNGAATATALSTIIWNLLAVIAVKKEYGFISIPNPFSK